MARSTPMVAHNGLQILLSILGLSDSSDSSDESVLEQNEDIIEPVIVSIDFENLEGLGRKKLSPNLNAQAGLAILDTRNLTECISPDQITKIISTYNFVCGSLEYQIRALSKLHFGDPIVTEPAHMLASIESKVPKDRCVVFVGHGIRTDLSTLRKMGFHFQERRISTFLDTQRMGSEVYPGWDPSLYRLLERLECSYSGLHNAGNDANFTLRASLLLAVKYSHHNCHFGDRLDDLERIGHSTVPDRSSVLLEYIEGLELQLAGAQAPETRKFFMKLIEILQLYQPSSKNMQGEGIRKAKEKAMRDKHGHFGHLRAWQTPIAHIQSVVSCA